MVKVQKTIQEFSRIRLGRPERVSKHVRGYDIKPRLSKEEIRRIKKKPIKTLINKRSKEQIPPKNIIMRRNRNYSNTPIPITICSFRKTPIENDYPANLYTCTRIKGFRNKFKKYIVLSRKNGLMFSDDKYSQYKDKEEKTDEELIKLLKEQRAIYPNLKLYHYNPRPLTGTKWFKILKSAGFEVIDFRKLADFDKIKDKNQKEINKW